MPEMPSLAHSRHRCYSIWMILRLGTVNRIGRYSIEVSNHRGCSPSRVHGLLQQTIEEVPRRAGCHLRPGRYTVSWTICCVKGENMFVYHLVYDIPDPTTDPRKYRILVAYKNVYGTRFRGEETTPRVLNAAGQLVIPGGDPEIAMESKEDVIEGGRKEFFEETGIDFGEGETPPWSELLHWGRDSRSYCVYQRVKDVEVVSRACNENIRESDPGSRPRDQELFSTMVRDVSGVSDVWRYFGPIPEIALKSGWRGEQYNLLDAAQKKEAVEKSFYPGDWFVTAVELLLRSDN